MPISEHRQALHSLLRENKEQLVELLSSVFKQRAEYYRAWELAQADAAVTEVDPSIRFFRELLKQKMLQAMDRKNNKENEYEVSNDLRGVTQLIHFEADWD